MTHHPQSTPPSRRRSRNRRRRGIPQREFNERVLDVLRDMSVMNGITRMMAELSILAENSRLDVQLNPISTEMTNALRDQYRRLDESVCSLIELAGDME